MNEADAFFDKTHQNNSHSSINVPSDSNSNGNNNTLSVNICSSKPASEEINSPVNYELEDVRDWFRQLKVNLNS